MITKPSCSGWLTTASRRPYRPAGVDGKLYTASRSFSSSPLTARPAFLSMPHTPTHTLLIPPTTSPHCSRDAQTEDTYYFNYETGESLWDHPCDRIFQEVRTFPSPRTFAARLPFLCAITDTHVLKLFRLTIKSRRARSVVDPRQSPCTRPSSKASCRTRSFPSKRHRPAEMRRPSHSGRAPPQPPPHVQRLVRAGARVA